MLITHMRLLNFGLQFVASQDGKMLNAIGVFWFSVSPNFNFIAFL